MIIELIHLVKTQYGNAYCVVRLSNTKHGVVFLKGLSFIKDTLQEYDTEDAARYGASVLAQFSSRNDKGTMLFGNGDGATHIFHSLI